MNKFRTSALVFLITYLILINANDFKSKKYYKKIHSVKLYGNTTQLYYYVNLYVGSPPQKQSLLIDTSSHITTFPCSECHKNQCGKHIDKPFNVQDSYTAKQIKCGHQIGRKYHCNKCDSKNRCKFNIDYLEGSTLEGYFIDDYLIIGDEIQDYLDKNDQENKQLLKFVNHEKVQMKFGCTTKETMQFLSQKANGLLGLAPKSNSFKTVPSIIDEYYKQHKDNDEKLAFSLCLSPINGGFMSVGGYNSELHMKGSVTHIIPYDEKNNLYQINIHKLKIDGEAIDIKNFYNPIINSRSALFLAPYEIIKKLQQQLNDYCQKEGKCQGQREYGVCFRRDPLQFPKISKFFDTFPKITFQLDNNFEFEWFPTSYLFTDSQRPNNQNLYCFAFETNQQDNIVLGVSWMQQYDILFDQTNKNLHFTQSDCDSDRIQKINIDKQGIKTTKSDQEYFRLISSPDIKKIMHYLMLIFIGIPVMIVGLLQLIKLCKQQMAKKMQNMYPIQENDQETEKDLKLQNQKDKLNEQHIVQKHDRNQISMIEYDDKFQSEEIDPEYGNTYSDGSPNNNKTLNTYEDEDRVEIDHEQEQIEEDQQMNDFQIKFTK